MGGSLFFSADFNANGRELWTYTTNAPGAVKDVKPAIDFTVYPNPAQQLIHVSSKAKIMSITLTDLLYSQLKKVSNATSIEIADSASDFFIQIKTPKGVGYKSLLNNST